MKTDSLFYRIFQTAPSILLELAGASPTEATGYEFRSVELKQTAFRIDGVLIPPQNENKPVYFVEVQFQRDDQLYHRFFAELFLYLAQNPNTADWRGVLVYPNCQIQPQQTPLHQILMESDKVQQIYLSELGAINSLPMGLSLLKLIVEPEQTAVEQARILLKRSVLDFELSKSEILDLVGTILLYKLNLNREEISTMLELYELEETRFYQEVSADVLKKDHQRYLERLLNNRLGTPTSTDTLQQRLQVIQNLLILKGDQFFDLTTALARENSKLCLVEILTVRFQNIPESVMAKVEKVENSTKENWIWLALTAESIAAFAEAIGIENNSLNLLKPTNPT
jgi:predicted transposase/invertase (TIGR01784 family)